MKILKSFLLVSATLVLFSCGDDASSRVKKENVEASKIKSEEMQKGFPVISFEKEKHDFGTLIEGDTVSTVFKFKNTGETALIITNARSSCGCTVPKYPEQPIQVGEEAEIYVKFNSRGKRGKQNKQVILTTNTEKGRDIFYVLADVQKKQS